MDEIVSEWMGWLGRTVLVLTAVLCGGIWAQATLTHRSCGFKHVARRGPLRATPLFTAAAVVGVATRTGAFGQGDGASGPPEGRAAEPDRAPSRATASSGKSAGAPAACSHDRRGDGQAAARHLDRTDPTSTSRARATAATRHREEKS